ncbi:MAG TPA: M48 family metalloprotease [Gallionella sp.]|nr:M48 family metalloprotease [Gallionella sp.]
MDRQKYEMLVWSLQGEALDAPGSFRARVLMISMTAYLVLFGMLSLLLVSLLFLWKASNTAVYVKYLLVSWLVALIPILWMLLRMFFMRIPPPEERELTEADAPKLFEMIAELRKRVHGAPVHHVLITNEFNASVLQHPRFGMFGGYRNYLILGLPLLYAVSAEEFKGVLAHECGHLAGGHNKFTRWIGRQRDTFGLLYEHAMKRREDSWINGLIAAMLEWFWPYFSAYTFVLRRQHEYEADAVAASVAGAQATASMLVRFNLLAAWLHNSFWKKMYEQASQHAKPPFMPYVSMGKLLAVTMDEWATKERLNKAWKRESDAQDTHPCLRERLTAMEQHAALPGMVKVSAADALLGKFALTLARELDEQWWSAEKSNWQSHHRRYTRSIERIAELEQRPLQELSVMEAQELGVLLFEFRSLESAKVVLQSLVKHSGERFPKPLFYYGRILLGEDNETGLDYLKEACTLAPSMWDDCARTGYQWLCANRSEAAADDWLNRMCKQAEE